MKLYHPTTVLGVALLLVALVQVAIGSRFDREARLVSDRQAEAGFPLDDAWIHQVYARSLADEGKLAYNPGAAETGQSSLLWGVLLAPVHRIAEALDVPVPRATRVFGIAIWVLLALAAAVLVASLPVPGARFGGACVALLVALDPAIAFAAVSGMEPLLFALFAVLTVLGTLRGRPLLLGVAGGLCILSRPEGVMVVGAAIGAACLHRSKDGAELASPARVAVRAVMPAVLLTSIWVGFCLTVTGRPFPNTWYQKAHDLPIGEAVGAGFALLGGMLASMPFFESYVAYLFLFIGVVALGARLPSALSALLILLPPVFCVAVSATRPMPDPTAFFWERYLTPMLPFLHVITAVGFAGAGAVLLDLVRPSTKEDNSEEASAPDESANAESATPDATEQVVDPDAKPIEMAPEKAQLLVPDVVLAVALVIVGLVPFTHAPGRIFERITEFGENVRDVDAINVAAGVWLAGAGLPAGTLVASQDAGAIRYFGPHEVLDLIGLNDHDLVSRGLRDGTIGPYLEERNPKILCLLDPDPGAAEFAEWGLRRGLKERARLGVPAYSLFGEPIPKSIVILAP